MKSPHCRPPHCGATSAACGIEAGPNRLVNGARHRTAPISLPPCERLFVHAAQYVTSNEELFLGETATNSEQMSSQRDIAVGPRGDSYQPMVCIY
jgi:hypothetical protein